MTETIARCECTNRLTADDLDYGDGMCEWCRFGECEILVYVDQVGAGAEMIGTCTAGHPVYRSHIAGTIYHVGEMH